MDNGTSSKQEEGISSADLDYTKDLELAKIRGEGAHVYVFFIHPNMSETETTMQLEKNLKAWNKRSRQKKLEKGDFFEKNSKHKEILDRQNDRVLFEIPRPINLDMFEEAYPVVLKTVHMYAKQLGIKNPITVEAISHLRKLAFILEKECEFGAANDETENE